MGAQHTIRILSSRMFLKRSSKMVSEFSTCILTPIKLQTFSTLRVYAVLYVTMNTNGRHLLFFIAYGLAT